MNLTDIQIRDPYILTDKENNCYYLFGTTDKDAWNEGISFQGYRSNDLIEFDGPFTLFENSPDFWAEKNFWAPEVHAYKGKYYMFASFFSEEKRRGTQILVSDTPLGRYKPISSGAVTPAGWECLDGTLYVDREGAPWIVFCHEWLQVTDGEICCMKLAEDLTHAVSEPKVLFSASQSGWARPVNAEGVYVTDGPFIYTTKTGRVLLLWSSFVNNKYAIGIARAVKNQIDGPYEHPGCLYEGDGGHGMVFEDLNGKLYLSVHKPNDTPNERLLLLPLQDTGETLTIG